MDITMLGTGYAQAVDCYNTCFVLGEDGEKDKFLVDAGGGNGILSRLRDAGIDVCDIHDVFVTHRHIDHILGVIWIIRIICRNIDSGKYSGCLDIYGHDEVISIIDDMTKNLLQKKESAHIGERIRLIVTGDGQSAKIIGKKVTFFDINSTKAKQFGFRMELGEKGALTCCGDEPCDKRCIKYAEDSTWLLHEAFCLKSEEDIFRPYEKHHSTVKDACELAESLGVENLLLYHTEDKNLSHRKELYLAEGRKYYHGNLFVPDDLEVVHI